MRVRPSKKGARVAEENVVAEKRVLIFEREDLGVRARPYLYPSSSQNEARAASYQDKAV